MDIKCAVNTPATRKTTWIEFIHKYSPSCLLILLLQLQLFRCNQACINPDVLLLYTALSCHKDNQSRSASMLPRLTVHFPRQLQWVNIMKASSHNTINTGIYWIPSLCNSLWCYVLLRGWFSWQIVSRELIHIVESPRPKCVVNFK